jgi:hypothetical protein
VESLMPVVVDNFTCPSCGTRHDLCQLSANSLDAGGEYEFKAVPFAVRPWKRITVVCPPGFVRVRPMR